MARWRLRLRHRETHAVRYGDVLYASALEARQQAEAWNALALNEIAEAVTAPEGAPATARSVPGPD